MKKILTLLFTLMVLTACTKSVNNEYNFIGESEHWEAEYVYKSTENWGKSNGKTTYENQDEYEIQLKYKGTLEELSSMKKMEYSYETKNSSGEFSTEFTEPTKKLVFKGSGGSTGGAKLEKDEVILVKVKWNDFEESFELRNDIK